MSNSAEYLSGLREKKNSPKASKCALKRMERKKQEEEDARLLTCSARLAALQETDTSEAAAAASERGHLGQSWWRAQAVSQPLFR